MGWLALQAPIFPPPRNATQDPYFTPKKAELVLISSPGGRQLSAPDPPEQA
jgi:hypothetical protein